MAFGFPRLIDRVAAAFMVGSMVFVGALYGLYLAQFWFPSITVAWAFVGGALAGVCASIVAWTRHGVFLSEDGLRLVGLFRTRHIAWSQVGAIRIDPGKRGGPLSASRSRGVDITLTDGQKVRMPLSSFNPKATAEHIESAWRRATPQRPDSPGARVPA